MDRIEKVGIILLHEIAPRGFITAHGIPCDDDGLLRNNLPDCPGLEFCCRSIRILLLIAIGKTGKNIRNPDKIIGNADIGPPSVSRKHKFLFRKRMELPVQPGAS